MNALPLVNEKSGITLYYNMQADTKSALYAPPLPRNRRLIRGCAPAVETIAAQLFTLDNQLMLC